MNLRSDMQTFQVYSSRMQMVQVSFIACAPSFQHWCNSIYNDQRILCKRNYWKSNISSSFFTFLPQNNQQQRYSKKEKKKKKKKERKTHVIRFKSKHHFHTINKSEKRTLMRVYMRARVCQCVRQTWGWLKLAKHADRNIDT